MQELLETLKTIDDILKAADDNKELKELLKDYPEMEDLITLIEDYEAEFADQFNESKDEIIGVLKEFIKDGEEGTALGVHLPALESDMTGADTIASRVAIVSNLFMTRALTTLVPIMMKNIDVDTPFEKLSKRTLTWIDSWSDDLGKLMKNTNSDAVSRALKAGLENGEGIDEIVRRLEELPAFNRARARATAITEILTANSVSQQEAYSQSPAVTKKEWLHSGGKGINPRPAHVALSGTQVDVEDSFNVNGHSAMYPRATTLPASERVYCHCVLVPVIDKEILLKPKAEKIQLQTQALDNME